MEGAKKLWSFYNTVYLYSIHTNYTNVMAELIQFDRLQNFYDYNKAFLFENKLLNYWLIKSIFKVDEEKTRIIRALSVIGTDGKQIVAMLTEVECLVYGNTACLGMIELLSDGLEFHKINWYHFAGSKIVIDALFERHGVKSSVQKHRVIYRCQKVNDQFSYAPGELQMASMHDFSELVKMSVKFTKDFDGADSTHEQMAATVIKCIETNSLYQWVCNNRICSIVQGEREEYDFPVIRHFYTDTAFRGKGFGASIVHRVTKGLLDVGFEYCMLTADAKNPISNKVFQKVGYESTGEYIRTIKEK
jgi:predicted GNAT family acetyltransferase